MCIICCCGSRARRVSFTAARCAAIYSGIQAVAFFTINLILILLYQCKIVPTTYDGATFIKELRTWFFYDEQECIDELGSAYVEPAWIKEQEIEYIRMTKNYQYGDAVEAQDNYAYQVVYLVFDVLWFFSSFLVIWGTISKKPIYFIGYLLVTSFLIIFDISLAIIYISFWDQTNPGWEKGSAIFSMIFLYLRGFLFEIINMICLCKVFSAYRMARRMRIGLTQQTQTNVTVELNTTVYPGTIGTSGNIGSEEESENKTRIPRVTLEPPPAYDNTGYLAESKVPWPQLDDTKVAIPRAEVAQPSKSEK